MNNKQHTTTAGEDYLESVLILQKKLGMVRSVDVARYMEVSKPSVCYAVGTLREGGFLTTDENWSYVKKKYKLNVTNFPFFCNC